MNQKQRIAILVGSILVALNLLFPTYNIRRYSNKGVFVGMDQSEIGFIFSPPSHTRTAYTSYEATVDVTSLLLRAAFFAALTGGVVFFFGDGRRNQSDRA